MIFGLVRRDGEEEVLGCENDNHVTSATGSWWQTRYVGLLL